ncbi:MAG TPA: hypothetical protein VNC50_12980 [Planctomycetia bacterium]|nr:hypothetical protein [Planctomycetia bacterium]
MARPGRFALQRLLLALSATAGAALLLVDGSAAMRADTPVSKPLPPELAAALAPAQPLVPEPVDVPGGPYPAVPATAPVISDAKIAAGSASCIACHQNSHDPHLKRTVRLSCVDCHGGDATQFAKEKAHVQPCFPAEWYGASNPVRSYTLLNRETPEFVRFVNPGDLRVAHISCGTAKCHAEMVTQVKMNMMTHGAMLWGAALYNNGAVPNKRPAFGESYSMHGKPQRLQTIPAPTEKEQREEMILTHLDPLPRFAVSQPGNVLRIFEPGGRFKVEIGVPEREEEPGRPRTRLSERGLGTANRTDPVFIGLQKTRLFDPTLNFLGTNDHPGDYRSSGCTACHMIYANDSSPAHSGLYSVFGKQGRSFDSDPTLPKDKSGHPIQHRFAVSIPSSQCMVCHIHPGTTLMNSYFGYMWWDLETDRQHMYPGRERRLTENDVVQSQLADPNEIASRGLWKDKPFLENLHEVNGKLGGGQFAEFAGHGWVFRAVYKRDRKGNMLDYTGAPIETGHSEEAGHGPEIVRTKAVVKEGGEPALAGVDADVLAAAMNAKLRKATEPLYDSRGRPLRDKAGKIQNKQTDEFRGVPVHLEDVHQRAGMHCIDCHYLQSMHGNGKLYGELRAAIEIACIDCHGTAGKRATLMTSGPMSRQGAKNLAEYRTPFGKPRFERKGDVIVQNSMMFSDLSWEVPETADVVDPASKRYNEKAALAKTLRPSGKGEWVWGAPPTAVDEKSCVHAAEKINCISCHSSWNQSCSGCHLPQKANKKMPDLHNEGDVTRNYVSYNFQTLREDIFMLAKDGISTGGRINPARSSCAIHVTSYNGNREAIYQMQQTISAEGFAGTAFSVNVPHTVSAGPPLISDRSSPLHGRPIDSKFAYKSGHSETKGCTDCHPSVANDNNALMAQLLMHGTNYTNLIGRLAWVGAGHHGLAAVGVTERDEPQTVIGSAMHKTVYPSRYEEHEKHHHELHHFHEHPGKDIADNFFNPFRGTDVQGLVFRGEYLYAACGPAGVKIFDVAFIEHKGFAERIVTAPVSPIGQKFYVPTKNAKAVAAPSTMAVDPVRKQRPENHEQKPSLVYAFIYVADAEEGLVMINAATLLDGNPMNNFVKRDVTFNPNGILCGANNVTVVGNFVYVTTDKALVVISVEDPTKPKVTAVINEPLHHPTDVQVQFRYAFVGDHAGVKVFDVTDLAQPKFVTEIGGFGEARRIYVARTYAYVAAGKNGLVILDVENPERPKVDQIFTEELCDVHDVKLGIVYNSEYAYLADGKGGLKVLQLTSPETPGNQGWSPKPHPHVIAHFKFPKDGEIKCVSKGLDRDRAVDESGNQIAVFGRVGARPMNLEEQRRLYMKPDGSILKVAEDPRAQPPYIRKTGK